MATATVAKVAEKKALNPRICLSIYTALYKRYRKTQGGRDVLRAHRGRLEVKRQDFLELKQTWEVRFAIISLEAYREALAGLREYHFEVVGVFTPRQRREYPESILSALEYFRAFGLEAEIARSERVVDKITAIIKIRW